MPNKPVFSEYFIPSKPVQDHLKAHYHLYDANDSSIYLKHQICYEASFILRLVFIFSISLVLAYGLRMWLNNQELNLVENQIIWSNSLTPSEQDLPKRDVRNTPFNSQLFSELQQTEWPFMVSKSMQTKMGW